MKKSILIFLGFSLVIGLSAQKDSLRKFRLSGIQVDIGPTIYPDYKQQSQSDYQKIVKNDPFLSADVSTYQKQQGYVFNNVFNGLTSVKCYITIHDNRKLKKEFFFGLKFGQEGNTGTYYTKQDYDTIGVYTQTATGKKIYEISGVESDFGFVYTSQKLIVPLGMNISTDKKKLFWITMGLELAPVFNFNYVFTSSHGEAYSDLIIKEGDPLKTPDHYEVVSSNQTQNNMRNDTKLKGLGYGLYASVPFTVYLHPFKRAAFLKHLNLLASISPLYMYSYSKYFGSASGITMSLATGIRYNW